MIAVAANRRVQHVRQPIRDRSLRIDELWDGLGLLADVDGPRSMACSDFQLRLCQRGYGAACASRIEARLVELGLAQRFGLVLMLTDAGDRAAWRGRPAIDSILLPT